MGINLLARHLASLHTRARTLTRNEADAEDLVQETCARALAALAQMKAPPAHPGAWLWIVMRNVWLNTLRSRRAAAKTKTSLARQRTDSSLLDARITRTQLVRIWEGVPGRARMLVVACLVDGEGRATVAQTSGMTRGAIEASIYRTRKIFREEGLWT
jgi:RNA polymerase sigma factor (sigma-70 family)